MPEIYEEGKGRDCHCGCGGKYFSGQNVITLFKGDDNSIYITAYQSHHAEPNCDIPNRTGFRFPESMKEELI